MKHVAVFLALIVLASSLSLAQGLRSDHLPTITVTGEAMVNVVPDRIVISCGIQTYHASIDRAKQENRDILRNAMAQLQDVRIPTSDIQTDQISVDETYRDDENGKSKRVFVVRNSFTVTVHDPARVEVVVTALLEEGVNEILGVDFQTTELRKHRDRARELALKAAREKAQAMTAALDAGIGKPLRIVENNVGTGWWYGGVWSRWYSRGGGSMVQNVVQDAGAPAGMTESGFAPGTIGVRASVSVEFELR